MHIFILKKNLDYCFIVLRVKFTSFVQLPALSLKNAVTVT